MKIEFFHAQGCGSCMGSQPTLKAAALKAAPEVSWRDIDPLQELDYAVELGVASLPSVAIDGKVAFTSLPTPEQLCKAVLARRAEVSNGR